MARTCLVLGGRGFVGSAIVKAAEKHGWEATACGKEDLDALAGSSWDLIINANGNSKKYLSDREPLTDFDLSVRSVAHSLEAFKTAHYVFLSTVDVYSDKSNPANNGETSHIEPQSISRYGFHKWLAEQLVQKFSENWLIIRVAGCVGCGLKKNPVYDLLNHGELYVHPDSSYQYINTTELADVVFELAKKQVAQEILNLAGEGTLSIREIASMIPDAELKAGDENLQRETYQINIERIKAHCRISESKDTVAEFINQVKSGTAVLS